MSKKKEDKKNEEALVKKIEAYKKYVEDYRIKDEAMWYEIQNFKDGNHYVYIDKQYNNIKLVPVSTRRGEIRRTINKIRSILRGIKTMTTATEPRWEVIGGGDEAKYLSAFYETYKVKEKLKDVVDYGFMRSLGYWEIIWSDEEERPVIRCWDSFDIYEDPHGRFIIKSVKKPLSQIKANKNYKNTDKLTAESKQASSDVKNKYLSQKHTLNTSGEESLDDVILNEAYLIEAPDNNDDDNNNTKIRIVTTCQKKLLREEVTDLDESPFLSYYPEKKPGELYNIPWLKDLIDPNKSLDRIWNHLEENMRTVGKGRILKKKGQSVSRLSDKDGQVVEYEGSTAPQQWQAQETPQSHLIFWNYVIKLMEDLGGYHSESLGRLSGSAKSGKAIAYLQAADQTNTSEPFDNLKDFLAEAGRRILKLVAKHQNTSGTLYHRDEGNEYKEFKFIGEASKNQPKEASVIKPIENVKVEIVPGGAFSAMILKQDLMALFQAGAIDRATLLEGWKQGKVSEIIEKVEREIRKGVRPDLAAPRIQQEGEMPLDLESGEVGREGGETTLPSKEPNLNPRPSVI